MWCSYKYPCQSSLVCDAAFASIADCGQVAAVFVSPFTMKTYKQTDGERDVRHPQSKHVAFFGSFSRCCWQFTGGSDEPEKLSFTQPKKTRSWKVCLGLKVPKLKLTPVDGVTDFLQTVYVKIRQTWNKKFPCYFSNNLMFIWSSAVSQTDIKARENIKYNIEWPSVFSGGPLKLSFSNTVHSLLLLNAILTGPCQSTWVQRQSWAAGPFLIPFAPTHGVDSAAWDQTLLLFWNNTRLNLLYVTRLCSLIEHIYLEINASRWCTEHTGLGWIQVYLLDAVYGEFWFIQVVVIHRVAQLWLFGLLWIPEDMSQRDELSPEKPLVYSVNIQN